MLEEHWLGMISAGVDQSNLAMDYTDLCRKTFAWTTLWNTKGLQQTREKTEKPK